MGTVPGKFIYGRARARALMHDLILASWGTPGKLARRQRAKLKVCDVLKGRWSSIVQ